MESVHFAVTWWMTLFTGVECLPFSVIVRIFENVLSENIKILYRASLAFLKIKEKSLITNSRIDMIVGCIKEGLKGTECEGNDDQFFKIMFGLKLKRKELNVYHPLFKDELNDLFDVLEHTEPRLQRDISSHIVPVTNHLKRLQETLILLSNKHSTNTLYIYLYS